MGVRAGAAVGIAALRRIGIDQLPHRAAAIARPGQTLAEIVARTVTAGHTNLVTNERSVAKRPAGRVLIDVQQNAHGRPLAAPYCVRAFAAAPVSTPVMARELRAGLDPAKLNIKTVFARLEEKGDLWAEFWKRRQTLDGAIERLSGSVVTKTGEAAGKKRSRKT